MIGQKAGMLAEASQPGNGTAGVPGGEVARLYRLGLTMAEIAGVYGVSEWTVASRLDEAGVPRRARGGGAGLPADQAVGRYRRQPDRLEELAAQLGISPQVITGRAGRPPARERGHGRYRAEVSAADAARLYATGLTVGQIAGQYGVAAATILRRLDEAGVARRPKSPPAAFPVEEAARRVQQDGASFAGLARAYQVGEHAVRGQLNARGVRAPRGGPRVLRDVPARQIADLYATGLTMAEIAARYGVSRAVISARLDAAGAARRTGARPVPVAEAAALYRQGASIRTLAGKYAVNPATIRRRLTAAGVRMRPPGPRRKDIPVGEAAELYAAGHTMGQLAHRYRVCETVIYDRLSAAGAPIRRRTGFKQVDPDLLAALARRAGLEAAV